MADDEFPSVPVGSSSFVPRKASIDARTLRVLGPVCVVGLLGLGVTGALESAHPAVDAWTAPPRAVGDVIGTPLAGAAEIAIVRRLIESRLSAEESVLVALPEGTDPFLITYAGYQLLHLMYPRRVAVLDFAAVSSLAGFDAVVVFPGVPVTDGSPLATEGAVALYRIGAR